MPRMRADRHGDRGAVRQGPPRLARGLVLIRLARDADSAGIAEVYRPFVEGSRISFEEQAPDTAEIARRIAGERPGFHPWLVAEEGGAILGFASSSPFRSRRAYRWSVET